MALIKPGVWHTTIWASRLWPENLWVEYGAVIEEPSRTFTARKKTVRFTARKKTVRFTAREQ